MLCLSESIRHDDPSLQQGLQSAYHAANLTELILAAWALARVLAVHVVESVLREGAGRPTPWPPCPECGKALRRIAGFALFYTSRFIFKGHVIPEEIVFTLKHYWMTVDCEPFELYSVA